MEASFGRRGMGWEGGVAGVLEVEEEWLVGVEGVTGGGWARAGLAMVPCAERGTTSRASR